jgi:hypothetical protein
VRVREHLEGAIDLLRFQTVVLLDFVAEAFDVSEIVLRPGVIVRGSNDVCVRVRRYREHAVRIEDGVFIIWNRMTLGLLGTFGIAEPRLFLGFQHRLGGLAGYLSLLLLGFLSFLREPPLLLLLLFPLMPLLIVVSALAIRAICRGAAYGFSGFATARCAQISGAFHASPADPTHTRCPRPCFHREKQTEGRRAQGREREYDDDPCPRRRRVAARCRHGGSDQLRIRGSSGDLRGFRGSASPTIPASLQCSQLAGQATQISFASLGATNLLARGIDSAAVTARKLIEIAAEIGAQRR